MRKLENPINTKSVQENMFDAIFSQIFFRAQQGGRSERRNSSLRIADSNFLYIMQCREGKDC
jgi:hypothetical protein